MNNVIEFPVKREEENKLVREIKDVVYSYAGKMTIAAAFGCIEIAKIDLERELLDVQH